MGRRFREDNDNQPPTDKELDKGDKYGERQGDRWGRENDRTRGKGGY